MHTKRRGYCPLEFIPSEEAVIKALKSNGKCFIHYHLSEGTVETGIWCSDAADRLGPLLFRHLNNNEFVRRRHDLIQKIVVSAYNNIFL